MANNDLYTSPGIVVREALGGASAITVPLDFKPIRVEVINKTTNSIYIWTPLHGAAGHTSIIDSGAGTTDIATVTSDGITVSNAGVILGTAVQTTNDVLFCTFWRSSR